MTNKECLDIFGIRDVMNLPLAAMEVLTGDARARDDVFHALLKANGYDMSRDWFQPIYESELSEGKRKGQHFTPVEVYSLLSQLTGQGEGSVHEPTAGTGGLIIGHWWEKCKGKLPWQCFPSLHFVNAWELSDRAVPLLLLNLSIRGMMGVVTHGDVLEQTVIKRYILLNREDDPLAFSDVIEDIYNNLKIVRP